MDTGMYHIAIADDEPLAGDELEKLIARFALEHHLDLTTDRFSDGRELLECDPGNYEIIFLDIEMKQVDGLETARQIRMQDDKAIIVFLTGFVQYAVKGYSVRAMSFLVKPVDYETLAEELEKAISLVDRLKPAYICIQSGEEMVKLAVDDIIYVETVGRKVSIHTSGKFYSCWETISGLERKLSGKGFFRCHKAFLVNLSHLESIMDNKAVVGGKEVLVSRDKHRELMHALVRFASERA